MKKLIILEMANNHSGMVEHGKKLLMLIQKYVLISWKNMSLFLNFNIVT